MVAINGENVANLVSAAKAGLKSKTFGGVSSDSATEAIQKVADGVRKMADEAVGNIQRELNEFKGKTAREMADLTSQKDAFKLKAENEAQRADKAEGIIPALKEKVAKYTTTKEGKPKLLSNGNTETVKVNKNGARMTTEKTPEDKVLSVAVETINGDRRKTTFDPVTGKPLKTFTNVNGDKLIEYTEKGAKIKDVNVKKAVAKKPELLSDKVVGTTSDNKYQLIKRTYSDGSYEDIKYDPYNQLAALTEKFNGNGKLVETVSIQRMRDGNLMTSIASINPETGAVTKILEQYNGRTRLSFYNENGKQYKEVQKLPNGLKRIITAKTDKYGNVDASNPTLKYIYPKNSKIKSSTIDYRCQFDVKNETLTMRDGSTVSVLVDGNYRPYKVTIMKKGEEPVELAREEIGDYLAEIGKVGVREDRKYYSNTFRW